MFGKSLFLPVVLFGTIFYGCTADNGTYSDYLSQDPSESEVISSSESTNAPHNPNDPDNLAPIGTLSSSSHARSSSTIALSSSSHSKSSSSSTTTPAAMSSSVLDSSSAVSPKSSAMQAPLSSSANTVKSSSSATILIPPLSSSALDVKSSSSKQSSSSVVLESSSSGLKEYEDNHKPKDSFLPAAGFYKSLTIEPLTPQKGGEIRCTFDGSYPTVKSEQITETLRITENTVIRCSEFVEGIAADTTTQTYFINESVSMPVVAITVNHHDMFDSTDGLYATGDLSGAGAGTGFGGGLGGNWGMAGGANISDDNNPKCVEPCQGANFWSEKELPVHVEFFENGSSSKSKAWEIEAGLSITGNWSRYKPKKSVAIKMDNDIYGDKVLKYSLFKTRPEAKKIKAFNLRNNGNRYWTDYIGDAMMTALLEGTDVDYQRSRQVVVFYNGEYFGIHDLRERLNRSYVETNYGIDSKSINMIKIKGTELEASGTNGASVTEYQQLVSAITSGKFEGENNKSYKDIQTKMNVNSFAQYMFAEMYFHNGDWPTNNVRAWGGNGYPFKFVAFDTDHGFGFTPAITGFDAEKQNMFDWVLGAEGTIGPGMGGGMWGGGMVGFGGASAGPGQMLKQLLNNPDFKRLFINNACILLNNYLTYEKVQKTVQSMMATMPVSERNRDQQRWPRDQSNFVWDDDGDNLIAYAKNRSETIKKEMADRFGLEDEVSATIAASGNGKILVDGMNLPSKTYKGNFFSNNELLLTAVPEGGAVFTGWSDGSTENPHKINVSETPTISATFK